MAIEYVGIFTKFDTELSENILKPLVDLNLKYNYAFHSPTYSKLLGYVSSNEPVTFSLSGGFNLITTTETSWINSEGTFYTKNAGTHKWDSTIINQPIYIRSALIPAEYNISISSGHEGDFLNSFSKSYDISLSNNTPFSIIEKVDENIIRSLDNQVGNNSYTIDLSSIWSDLKYGKHTIYIALSSEGYDLTTITITFNKIKSPVQPIPTNSNLKQVMLHNNELEKEITYQNYRLSEKLKAGGIEVVEGESLSNLINRIEIGKMWSAGKSIVSDNTFPFEFASSTATTNLYYIEIPKINIGFTPSFVICRGFYQKTSCVYLMYEPYSNDNKEMRVKSIRYDYNSSGQSTQPMKSYENESILRLGTYHKYEGMEFEWVAYE